MKGTYIERPKVSKSLEHKKKKKETKDQPRVPNQMPPNMPPGPMVQGYMPGVFTAHPPMMRK